MNTRSPLRRLAALRPSELRFAARAWIGAPVVELSLAALGLRRTLAWIEAVPARDAGADRVRTPEGERLVGNVYRAHLLRGRCLPRSLLQYLLHRRDGTPARFVVGVRRDGEDLDAHAWVEPVEPDAPRSGSAATFSPIFTAREEFRA